jgi:hypothetical protein
MENKLLEFSGEKEKPRIQKKPKSKRREKDASLLLRERRMTARC